MNSPTEHNLSSVYFVDSLYGWATGLAGSIIHTSNGGTDWIIQDSNTENNIYDIFFLDRDLGWAISWEVYNYPFGTYLLKTTNGGDDWIISQNPEENMFSQCILFLDSLNGWMGSNSYPIVRTTDGGISWTEAEIDSSDFSNFPVYDIQFYDSNFGYASGGFVDCCGIIWLTTDGGNYWDVIESQYVTPEPIYQLYIIDSLNVIGIGGDFESWGYGVGMVHTADGGGSWNFEYIGVGGVSWDIDFRTKKEAWAPLTGEQKLIYSLDAGLTWSTVSTPDNVSIFKIMFPDSLHGFGVGTDGTIIRYKPDFSSFQDEEKYILKKFVLQQNYPNPFNPKTVISYQLPVTSKVTLKVYDILGNEVSALVDEEEQPGVYEVEFDASLLASGIYLYKLQFGYSETNSGQGIVQTKKMILLK